MVSYDVVSVHTSISIDECKDFVNGLLENDNTLFNRSSLCSSSTIKSIKLCKNAVFFTLKGSFCEQMNEAAMGSPVSPIVANLFTSYTLHIWLGYADDTFVVIKKDFS